MKCWLVSRANRSRLALSIGKREAAGDYTLELGRVLKRKRGNDIRIGHALLLFFFN